MKRRFLRCLAVSSLACLFFASPVYTQLANSPWPMFHANVRHAGQSAYAGSQRGTLFWSYRTGDEVWSSPAIDSDGRVYVGSWDARIYSFNSTGSLLWSYQTGYWVRSSPAIGSDGAVYVGSFDNSIYSLNSTGSLLWSYKTGDWVWSFPAIGSEGSVHVGSYDSMIYCINSTGSLLWSYQTGSTVYSSPAISSDGMVYVGSLDGRIYSLTSTGSLLWSYQTGNWVGSSPAIGSAGRVYVGSEDSSIYSLNSSGSLLWSYQAELLGVYSSPAIGSDGMVYVGTREPNGGLYVFLATAMIELNATSFRVGEQLVATFKVNERIKTMFDVYAVLIMPGGKMLNAGTLDKPLRPVATKIKSLPAGFAYRWSGKIPEIAPKGEYELAVAFFDAKKRYHSRADAFLDLKAKFSIQ